MDSFNPNKAGLFESNFFFFEIAAHLHISRRTNLISTYLEWVENKKNADFIFYILTSLRSRHRT